MIDSWCHFPWTLSSSKGECACEGNPLQKGQVTDATCMQLCIWFVHLWDIAQGSPTTSDHTDDLFPGAAWLSGCPSPCSNVKEEPCLVKGFSVKFDLVKYNNSDHF